MRNVALYLEKDIKLVCGSEHQSPTCELLHSTGRGLSETGCKAVTPHWDWCGAL